MFSLIRFYYDTLKSYLKNGNMVTFLKLRYVLT